MEDAPTVTFDADRLAGVLRKLTEVSEVLMQAQEAITDAQMFVVEQARVLED